MALDCKAFGHLFPIKPTKAKKFNRLFINITILNKQIFSLDLWFDGTHLYCQDENCRY